MTTGTKLHRGWRPDRVELAGEIRSADQRDQRELELDKGSTRVKQTCSGTYRRIGDRDDAARRRQAATDGGLRGEARVSSQRRRGSDGCVHRANAKLAVHGIGRWWRCGEEFRQRQLGWLTMAQS